MKTSIWVRQLPKVDSSTISKAEQLDQNILDLRVKMEKEINKMVLEFEKNLYPQYTESDIDKAKFEAYWKIQEWENPIFGLGLTEKNPEEPFIKIKP